MLYICSLSFRYVVRAKAGKKQSLKDGSGKSLHSAGASLRRHNELALKKVCHRNNQLFLLQFTLLLSLEDI